MPFPDGSVTTKSAEQVPAPPFTTGISALPGVCGAEKELTAKDDIETTIRLVRKTTSNILFEVCMRTPLKPGLWCKSRRGFRELSEVYRNPESSGCLILPLSRGNGAFRISRFF